MASTRPVAGPIAGPIVGIAVRACAVLLTATAATLTGPLLAEAPAQQWISAPGLDPAAKPVVLQFRRAFDLARRPAAFPVMVTADNRFILYVNGVRVAAGPSTSDLAHWREQPMDLAQWLKPGRNIISATVWDAVQPLKLPPNATTAQQSAAQGAALFTSTAPLFQQSQATGFRLVGSGAAAAVSTGQPGWRVRQDLGHGFANGWRQLKRWYYVGGNPETIDVSRAIFDRAGPVETGPGWEDAVAAPLAARPLVRDKLPAQTYEPVAAGKVVRTDLPQAITFPDKPVTIPANGKYRLLLQRDAMLAAYPQLSVSGGAGARIKITWAEALYDANYRKGDRNLIEDLRAVGIFDTFTADGTPRTFETLWWRTWRYAEIEVETGAQPLTLTGLKAYRTGYPFKQIGRFASDDAELTRVFDVGWRTAQLDAHETYMDTAYWEQLQYAGDTRLQMLISYAVAGDPRLAEQAIDAFASSRVEGGLMESAYPTRSSNVIATFPLLWIGMLDDWRMRQPERAPLVRSLGRMREVLAWFPQWQQPSGLLGKNPLWNFIDWTGQSATDRTSFPSWGKTNESCLMSVSWLGALQQAARVESAVGDAAHAQDDLRQAAALAKAIRERCWVPARGLFADNPDGDRFSQHMNALAVLYDVADPAEARTILDRIVKPGHGIDAPDGITPTSYYFAWYLAQAHVHAGLGERYLALLKTWRDLLKLNYTTWPEERDGAGQTGASGTTRSDSHAWSAHPSADLLEIVAGIGPGAPGYARVRVAPALGGLTQVNATAATPHGPVSVRYAVRSGWLDATITKPKGVPGEFVWHGRSHPLPATRTHLRLPVQP